MKRAEGFKRGGRWAANCLSCFYMARAFENYLPDEESRAAAAWLEEWEKALDSLPDDEARAARLIYCERLDAGEAAERMQISRIKAAGLAGRACIRLAEYFGRRVEGFEHCPQNWVE